MKPPKPILDYSHPQVIFSDLRGEICHLHMVLYEVPTLSHGADGLGDQAHASLSSCDPRSQPSFVQFLDSMCSLLLTSHCINSFLCLDHLHPPHSNLYGTFWSQRGPHFHCEATLDSAVLIRGCPRASLVSTFSIITLNTWFYNRFTAFSIPH